MKKNKKIMSIIIPLFISLLLILPIKVEASTAKVNVKSNKSSTVVGNTVTFTVTISSNSTIGVWDFSIDYDNFSLISGPKRVVDSGKKKEISYTYKMKAKNKGTGTFKVNVNDISDYETEKTMSIAGTRSKSVKIMSQEEIEASYSKDNYLSSLSIDDYALSPKFSKTTTNYTVDVEPDTTSVRVRASKNDSSASVRGLGEIKVKDGINKIYVKVTAENGQTRTYTITVNVKELDPIKVNIDNKEYTIIRKKSQLKKPNDLFKETTIKIDGNEVPALTNKEEKLYLVGLKDSQKNISLYIYQDGKYTKYNGYTSKGLTLAILNDEIKNMKKTTIKLNGEEIIAYKNSDKDFVYFYATNIENNNKSIYKYDIKEQTVQRYKENTTSIKNDIKEENEDFKIYKNIIIGLTSGLIITYFIILINLLKGPKKKKKRENMDELDIINEKLEQKERLKEEISVKIEDEDTTNQTSIEEEFINELKKDQEKEKQRKKKNKNKKKKN